jgi:hypothetical protein
MSLLFARAMAGNGITPDQKSSSSAANLPAAAVSTPSKSKAPAATPRSSIDKANVETTRTRKPKRRSKQVIIVIVVDDQESSWI